MSAKIRRIDFSGTEWQEGTVELDNAERGLFITACALMYARGGAITHDLLKAACRDHGHAFNRQLATLYRLGKLTINDGQITNKRCANELQKAEERRAKASQSGTEGNEIKKMLHATRSLDRDANHQLPTINHQEEKEVTPPAPPSGGRVIEATEAFDGRSSKRGTRLPADWQPNVEDCEFAASLGLGIGLGEVVAEFHDHWIGVPGARGCKLDWSATFRNRCRAIGNHRRGNGRQPSAYDNLIEGFGRAVGLGRPADSEPDWSAAGPLLDREHDRFDA